MLANNSLGKDCMNRVTRFFNKLVKVVGSIFTGTSNAVIIAIETGLLAVKPYFEDALSISEWAATLTSTTVDDKLVAFAKKYSVDVSTIVVAGRDEGDIIRDLIRLVLQKLFPDAATRWLNRVIELAYSKVKP